jgi:elongation factor Ts
VLVDVVGGDEQLGKDLAMHIAASKPKRWIRRVLPRI